MALQISDVLDSLVSHAQTTGYFERVNSHEPKNSPGTGLTCSIWVDKIFPARSGLDSTSATMYFNIRLQTNMVSEPQDAIDENLVTALDALMANYVGDFTLDGTVRNVDVRGIEGESLQVDAGYIEQDRKMFRIFVITLPVIVNDVWTETA